MIPPYTVSPFTAIKMRYRNTVYMDSKDFVQLPSSEKLIKEAHRVIVFAGCSSTEGQDR